MPRVPNYVLPGVDPQPGQSGGFSAPNVHPFQGGADAQIAGLGEGLQRSGAAIADAANRLQDQYNDAKVDQSYAFLAEAASSTLYDPKTGYLNTVGEAATGENRARAFAKIDQRRAELEKSLDNDVQREMFRHKAGRYLMDVKDHADRHEAKQIAAFEVGAAAAVGSNAVDNAIRFWQWPEEPQDPQGPQGPRRKSAFRLQFDAAVDAANRVSDQLGEGPDQRAARVTRHTTAIHAGIMRRLLTIENGTAADQATAYLADVPDDQIDPEVKTQMFDLINRQKAHDDALKLSVQLMGRTPAQARKDAIDNAALGMERQFAQAPDSPKPEGQEPKSFVDQVRARELDFQQRIAAAYAHADTIDDAALHDAFVKRIEEREKRHGDERAKAVGVVREQAESWLRNNPNTSFEGAPVELQQASEALGIADEVRKYAREGRRVTDPATRIALEDASGNQWKEWAKNREQFDAAFGGNLSLADLKWAHEQMAKSVGAAQGYDRRETEKVDAAKLAWMELGRDPESKNLQDRMKLQRWINEYRDSLDAEQQRPEKDRRSADDVLKTMKKNQLLLLAEPEARGDVAFEVGGREVLAKNLADPNDPARFDPDLLDRVQKRGGDPNDVHLLATEFELREQEKRAALVADTSKWIVENNVQALRRGSKIAVGYVPLDEVQRLTGWRRDSVLEFVGGLHQDGQDDPLHYARETYGRFDLTRDSSRPDGISILALGRLRQHIEAHR